MWDLLPRTQLPYDTELLTEFELQILYTFERPASHLIAGRCDYKTRYKTQCDSVLQFILGSSFKSPPAGWCLPIQRIQVNALSGDLVLTELERTHACCSVG